MGKIKYSIVMAYYNRRTLLMNTLYTIAKSAEISKTEVVIVDDGSDIFNRIDHLQDLFDFPITVIRVEPEDKWYHNPLVPYNMGIHCANGEVIILQNPEVMHTGDILADITSRFNDTDYLVYGVYAVSAAITEVLNKLNYQSNTLFSDIKNAINPMNNVQAYSADQCGWYNHSLIRPSALHFLSVISKKVMDKLEGFDERYSLGVDRDDNELLYRIKRNGVNVVIVDSPFAIHQNHPKVNYDKPNVAELRQRNIDLYNNVTLKETKWAPFNVRSIKVSVIIPFFNRIDWTIEAVKSALNQTHKNTEIILVNDCSTESIKDLTTFIKKYSNIQICSTLENSGAGAARNVGMSRATGNYVTFLDSDDIYLTHKIEKQLRFMVQDDLDASHTSYYLDDFGHFKFFDSGKSDVTFPDVIGSSNIATPSFMAKRKFLTDNDIIFPHYRASQDICFFIRVCQKTDIKGLPITLLRVREHPHRTVSQLTKVMLGMSNVFQFVLQDDELKKESVQIANLANVIKLVSLRYVNIDENPVRQTILDDLSDQIKVLQFEKQNVENLLQKTMNELRKESDRQIVVQSWEPEKANIAPKTYNTTTINPKHPKVRFTRKPV